jgi:hypothetical protein
MSHPKSDAIDQVPTYRFPNWPPAQTLQADPRVKVYFYGLMGFMYNQPVCDVGLYRADGRHRLEIRVVRNNQDDPPITLPPNLKTLSLAVRVSDTEKPAEVKFLKNGLEDDFRWMLDLQSQDFYPDVARSNDAFKVILTIKQGIFFTETRTMYNLDRVTRPFPFIETPLQLGKDPQDLGHPADCSGAAIDLVANESLYLLANNQEVISLPYQVDVSYEIYVSHECFENDNVCPFDHKSWRESKRNDFHYHRDGLALSTFRDRYSVALSPNQVIDKGGKVKTSTDLAPCMGAGYGR